MCIPNAFLELGIIWNGAILDVLLPLRNLTKVAPQQLQSIVKNLGCDVLDSYPCS